ncbi:MAG: carboxypeptidase-like regulatory domain-containing protein [Gemmataceae bacterium]|nr:carboxypeptidase-like regulatory domain-containing protein [Gemmataceae bacterium]
MSRYVYTPSVLPILRTCTLLVAMSTLACSASSPAMPTVTGQVTWRGAPAEGAVVVFHPVVETGDRPSGVVSAAGTFELNTAGRPGVLPGEYRVTIVWDRPPEGKPNARREDYVDAFRGRYSRPAESHLKATVPPQGGAIPIFALR